MAEEDTTSEEPREPVGGAIPWLAWLAWGWLLLLVLATVAELADWANLRLALDFQRHFR